MKRIQKSIRETNKLVGNVGPAASKSGRQFDRSLKQSRERVLSLRKAVGLLGGAMAAGFAFKGIKSSIEAASDLNESVNKARQTFKQSSPEIQAWSRTAVRSLGMTRQAALENAGSIGAMLIPMGVARDEAAAMSKRMVQLATDMASFNNEDPTEMLDRIRSGLSGESEPLKRFGAVLSETRVKQFAWASGLVKTGQELTEQQKILARYKLLLQDTRDQSGDFARTSGGLANQQRILNAALGEVRAEIGTALLPTITKLGSEAATFLSKPEVQQGIQQFSRRVGRELPSLMRETGDVIRGVAGVARDMAGALKRVADAVGGWRNAFEIVLSGVLASKLIAVSKGIRAVGLAAGTAGATGAAGAAVGTGAAGRVAGLRGQLGRLARVSAITIPIFIALDPESRKALDRVETFLENMLGKWAGMSLVDILRAGADEPGQQGPETGGLWGRTPPWQRRRARPRSDRDASATGAPGVTFSGQRLTHPTAGLGGFPAADIFAKPGTPFKAPESGQITSVDLSNVNVHSGQVFGAKVYMVGDSGTTYFITHVMGVEVRRGQRVRKGDVIGYVTAWSGGAPHAHVGVHRGGRATTPARDDAPDTPDRPTRDRDRPQTRARDLAAKLFQIPLRLRESLERSRGTSGLRDDLKALRDIEGVLQRALKGAKGERRLDLRQQLNQTREDIKGVKDRLKEAGAAASEFQQALAASRTDAKALQQVAASLPKGLAVSVRDEFGRVTDTLSPEKIRSRIAALNAQLGKTMDEKTRAKIQAQLDRLRETIGDALQAVQDEIERRRGVLEDAFGEIAERAFDAFEARTSGLLDGIRDRLQGTLEIIDAAREALTPAEQALNALRNQRETRENARRAADAQERVAKAQARLDRLTSVGASPRRLAEVQRELQEAQEELAEVQLDAQGRTLEQRAEAERKARDDEAEIARKAAEGVAAEEEKQLNASRAELRRQLLRRVSTLQTGLLAGNYTAEQALGEFNTILGDFGISADQSGFDIGLAFAKGFLEAFPIFKSAVDAFRDYLLTGTTTLPAITFVPGRGSRSAQPMAAGGIVRKPTLALLGEAGPEAVIPLRGSTSVGGGGLHLHLHNPTIIGNDLKRAAHELFQPLKTQINQHLLRNGRGDRLL